MKKLAAFLIAAFLVGVSIFGPTQIVGPVLGPVTLQATATAPTLPQVFINTAVSQTPVTGNSVNVPAGGNLQGAIDAANLGDEIVLAAGATYTGPIVLKKKLTGSGWITIRTNTPLPAEGTRVTPANGALMAKIVAPGFGETALKTEAGAHHYRIIGLELKKLNESVFTYGLATIGDNETQDTAAEIPHHIILDRMYIHGDSTSDLKYGVSANGNTVALIDSYVSDCHVVGQDAQAFVSTNSNGPIKVVNNYLEGAAENVLFGGDDPRLVNSVISDIEFRHNHVRKNPSWYDPTGSYSSQPHWSVKNLFELKNAQRVLADGNIFEYNWVDGQAGDAIVITPRNQYGTCTWCVDQDITFSNNLVRHVTAGLNIQGHDDEHVSQLTQRIRVFNNVWDDVNSTWTTNPSEQGTGRWMQVNGGTSAPGPSDLIVSHNTSFQNGTPLYLVSYLNNMFSTKPNLVVTDNIMNHGTYGVFGDNSGTGNPTLNAYATPGGVFSKNVMKGGTASDYSQYADNYFPTGWASVFVDQVGGNYRVLSTSVYHNTGTDGKDIGADIDALDLALAGVVSGDSGAPPPPPPPPPDPGPSGISVTNLGVSYRFRTTSTVSWTVSDSGSTIDFVEVWRAPYSSTCSEQTKSGCVWTLRKTIRPGSRTLTLWSSSTTDTVVRRAVYWYGMHALDAAGAYAEESAPVKYTAR